MLEAMDILNLIIKVKEFIRNGRYNQFIGEHPIRSTISMKQFSQEVLKPVRKLAK